jgi:hypothetical protein
MAEDKQTNEVEHAAITNIRVVSDGGSAARLEFELAGGGKAVVSASMEQPPPKDEPAGDVGAVEQKGKLPDGFPSKGELEAAGITTFTQLRKKIASGTEDAPWYADITGVAEGKAGKIEEALAAGSAEEA